MDPREGVPLALLWRRLGKLRVLGEKGFAGGSMNLYLSIREIFEAER